MIPMENGQSTILIIDDKESNIRALETLLEKPGRTFMSALTGERGLKLALEQNVDLIFLDVQMPGMDGFEVAQVLKSNHRTRNIPIIFASAEKKERDSVMKGFEEGAVDYLHKPLDPDLTKAKVNVLLQLQQQRKELIEKNLSLEKAEDQIKQHLAELQALNKELESFSYSVSHDLRSPLRCVLGYADILVEDYGDKLGEDGNEVIKVIQENATRMNRLIEDLLEFSKLGRRELSKSVTDVQQMVTNVIEQLRMSNPNNATFEIGTLSPAVADASLLMQVWVNLISNAVKYSSKNPAPVVSIGCEEMNKEITYWVKDNGAGFNMAYASKLFKVFQRLHKNDEFEGTGVGLALVQKIVIRHGGRIWAEGEVDKGATFYFALPKA